MQTDLTSSTRAYENVIDLIRKTRNDLIKDFLDERCLREYIADRYSAKEISNIKMEFIKKDLKELLIAPVDVNHYELLISRVKETGAASLSSDDEELFYQEITKILKNYI